MMELGKCPGLTTKLKHKYCPEDTAPQNGCSVSLSLMEAAK